MAVNMLSPKTLFSCMLTIEVLFFWSKFLLRSLNILHSSLQKKLLFTHDLQPKLHRYSSFTTKSDNLLHETLVFHMEEALLKSSSLFPYFMLVAFEAGGLLRAILLFLAHPLVWFFSKKMRIKIMVFICLFGIKKDKFRIGRSVLPKFFLEDVGYEGFEMVMRHKRKVAFSDLPTVMVEGFLKDYLGLDAVMGRQVKVAHGYFVGLMEERCNGNSFLNEIVGQEKFNALVGFSSLGTTFSQQFFSRCKEIYLVNNAEKSKWHILPRDKYPRRLIFHDGRLAFRPTFFATFLMFLWVPFGFFLCIIRAAAALLLPYKIAIPILAFTGMKGSLSISFTPSTEEEKSKGTLYVCNHRTLLDPIYVSMALMKPLTAVTYSVSRISEMLSPIRTARLMRDRENDLKMMKEMLCQGDLVVCPEGTTCREPYLLRFSPLFAEITDDIVPVALDMQASMFYGTTASGLKCLDPLFFLLNPSPTYIVRFLDRLPTSYTCASGGKSRYEVANYVQSEISKALGFECTSLTRKEKYMILAGNEGLSRPMLH